MNLTLKDFDKCCRWCLSKAARLDPIFDASLSDMFLTITKLEMEKGDLYPQRACQWCIKKLNAACSFRQTALRSHQTLSGILKANLSTVKSIPQDEKAEQSFDKPELQQIPNTLLGASTYNDTHDKDLAFNNIEQTDAVNDFTNCKPKIETVESHFDDYLDEVQDRNSQEAFATCNEMLDYKCNLSLQTKEDVPNKSQISGPVLNITYGHLSDCKRGEDKNRLNIEGCLEIKCEICQDKFVERSELKEHSLSHKDRCEVCSKMIYQHNMEQHLQTHKNGQQKALECNICLHRFTTKSLYKVHLRTAHKMKEHAFLCTHCGAMFQYDSSLRRHMDYHTNRNLRICDFCGKRFVRRHSLVEHLRSHTGVKPYSCVTCNKCFSQISSLRKHQRLLHAADGHYRCLLCEEIFHSRDVLKNHKKSAHGRHKCFKCKLSFEDSFSLQIHNGEHHPDTKASTASSAVTHCLQEIPDAAAQRNPEAVSVQCWCSGCGQGLQTLEDLQVP